MILIIINYLQKKILPFISGSFVKVIKDKVTGTIRVKLFKGNCVVVGRKSKNSLYDFNLATYDQGDTFNQDFAKGFIELWGLPTKVYSSVKRKNK